MKQRYNARDMLTIFLVIALFLSTLAGGIFLIGDVGEYVNAITGAATANVQVTVVDPASGGGGGGGEEGGEESGEESGEEGGEEGGEETGEEAGEEGGESGEEAGEEGGEQAQQGSGDGRSRDDDREIEQGEIIPATYGLEITKIIANDNIIYEDYEQKDTITIKDEDLLTLQVHVQNVEETTVEQITMGVTGIPEGLFINEITPKTIAALAPQETQIVTIELESTDISETFVLNVHAEASSASAMVRLSTVLEAGKGAVYYTRQKVIEETKEVIVRTYKFLFLLFLLPLLLLVHTTTIIDEKALRRMIDDKSITNYWRVYVVEDVYKKYDSLPNLKSIRIEDDQVQKATKIAKDKNIPYHFAELIVFANTRLLPRIFTLEEVDKSIRHAYPRVWFASPLHNYKEEQLKRFIERQQRKGFSNNEIRQVLKEAGWKQEVIQKYLDPEEELDHYIDNKKQQGMSLGEIRKQLLEVGWEKERINKHIPREEVLYEYIKAQRAQARPERAIRAAVARVGWEPQLINKVLHPEYELYRYIQRQLQRGAHSEILQEQLIKQGWKTEIISRHLPSNDKEKTKQQTKGKDKTTGQ